MTYPAQFLSGPRLIDGDALNRVVANPSFSYKSGIVAKAAGTVANSTLLTETMSQVDTVASAADGVLLPAATVGDFFMVQNNTANAMQVFAAGGSTINGTAGATGVSHAANKSAIYFCAKNGAWFRNLSA